MKKINLFIASVVALLVFASCGVGSNDNVYTKKAAVYKAAIKKLNAAADAEHQDQDGQNQCAALPEVVAVGGSHAAECAGEAVNGSGRQRGAGEGADHVLQDPAHDHGITNGQCQRTQHRNQTQCAAGSLLTQSALRSHTEGIHRACAGCAAERHLTDDAGGADEQNKQQIRNQEGTAAVCCHTGREQPDIAHADGRADAGQNEAPPGGKAVSAGLGGIGMFHD